MTAKANTKNAELMSSRQSAPGLSPLSASCPRPPGAAEVAIRHVFAILLIVAPCLILSLGVAQANWFLVAIAIGGVGYAALLSLGVTAIAFIWVLGIPTVFVIANNVLNAVPSLTMGRILFATIAGVLLVQHIALRKEIAPLNALEKAMATFLAFALVSLIYASATQPAANIVRDGAMYLTGYMMPMGAYFIARRIPWTPGLKARLIFLLFAAGVFLAATGVLQIFFGVDLFVAKFQDLRFGGIAQNRATGTFASAGEFGAVTAVFVVIGAFAMRRLSDKAAVSLAAVGVAFIIFGMLIGQTRGPWLALMVAFGALFVLDRSFRPALVVAGILAIAVFAAAFPFLLQSDVFESRVTEISPILNRLALWAIGVNMIVSNPLFGLGFSRSAFSASAADYVVELPGVSYKWAFGVGLPHNEFIHVGVLMGLPGLFLFGFVLHRTMGALRRALQLAPARSIDRELALCASAAFVVYLVNALLIDFGSWSYFGVLVFFLIGAATSGAEAHAKKHAPPL